MSDVIRRCHKLVWDFRKEAESYWPTPDRLDSLRYALTEIAEAIDAKMRLDRPDHVRNRDKDLRVESELADCAIMLLTAWGQEE